MDVSAATCADAVGDNLLQRLKPSVAIAEDGDLARQLAHQVGKTAVRAEHEVARTGIGTDLGGQTVGDDVLPLQAIGKDAVVAEIGGQRIAAVGSEACAVDVRGLLTR